METYNRVHTNTFTLKKNIIKETNEGILLTNNYLNLSMRNENKSQSTRVKQGNTKARIKNNVSMRRNHRIQQPGFDVQRFGHK